MILGAIAVLAISQQVPVKVQGPDPIYCYAEDYEIADLKDQLLYKYAVMLLEEEGYESVDKFKKENPDCDLACVIKRVTEKVRDER